MPSASSCLQCSVVFCLFIFFCLLGVIASIESTLHPPNSIVASTSPARCPFVRYGVVVGRAYAQPRISAHERFRRQNNGDALPPRQRPHPSYSRQGTAQRDPADTFQRRGLRADGGGGDNARTPDGPGTRGGVGRGAGPSSASYISTQEATPTERLLMFLRQKCSVVESRAQDDSPSKRMTQCVFVGFVFFDPLSRRTRAI